MHDCAHERTRDREHGGFARAFSAAVAADSRRARRSARAQGLSKPLGMREGLVSVLLVFLFSPGALAQLPVGGFLTLDRIEETLGESVERRVENAVEFATEQNIQENIEDSIEETIEQTVDASVEDSIDDAVAAALDEQFERNFEDSVVDGIESGIELGVEDSLELAVEDTVEDSVESAVEADIETNVEAELEGAIESVIESAVEDSVAASVEAGVQSNVEIAVEAAVEDEVLAGVEAVVEADIEGAIDDSVGAAVEAGIEADIEDNLLAAVEEAAEDAAVAAVEEAATAAAEASLEAEVAQSVETALESSVESAVESSVESAVESSVEGSIESAVEESVAQSVEESVEDGIAVAVEESVEDSVAASVEEDVESGVQNVVEASVEENIDSQVLLAIEDRLEQEIDEIVDNLESDLEIDESRILKEQWLVMAEPAVFSELTSKGYLFDTVTELPALGLRLAEVAAPSSFDISDVRNGVIDVVGKDRAEVDLNHFYTAGTPRPAADDGVAPRAAMAFPTDLDDLDVRVGMIDSRVDTEHPALLRSRIEARSFARQGADAPDFHGTAIASIIAANSDEYRGLAPKAQLYAASVFEIDKERGEIASTVSLIRALDWLLSSQVDVVNISLAGPPNRLLEKALARASEQQVVVMAAAGNGGPVARPMYPAAYESVVAVTAVDSAQQVFRLANRGDYLALAAPGVDLRHARAGGGYATSSGTSFAVPFAVTAAARLSRMMPKTDIIASLLENAEDIGPPGRDTIYGYGLLRLSAL
ncbi:MAG: S8 family serine peptidase, partial [Pseudomonadota bacterium]